MIVHVVLLQFKNPLTEDEKQKVATGFAGLPALIPQIKSYEFGPDIGLRAGNAEYSLIAKFATVEDFVVYRDHPDHMNFAKTVMGPLLKSAQASQFEMA